MKLPALAEPDNYQDLYVFDFGDWTAVGYTAAEVAVLLEDPRYATGRIYRIHRAYPDGRFELQGVPAVRFQAEAGMFFYCGDLGTAREDFDRLVQIAEDTPPPCRAYVHFADRGSEALPDQRFVVALVYPAEYDPAMARWLTEAEYLGGETVEGGVSAVTNYLEETKRIIDRRQFVGAESRRSRPAEEVLASVRRAVQR